VNLRVVGAGIGRTGTMSLKFALEKLLGGPCYHMLEVFAHPEHVPLWHEAFTTGTTDWDAIFDGYVATVDFPSAEIWEPLAAANPDAVVLLSTRATTDVWWKSVDTTIFNHIERVPDADDEVGRAWHAMAMTMLRRFGGDDWRQERVAKEAYERHNAHVRATVDPDRLLDYQPGDGWEPLCRALGVPIPDEPFPHVNTTEEWLGRFAGDPPH